MMMMMETNEWRIIARKRRNYVRKLNHDCLVQIFQYLPICDRIKLERVSKLWCAASLASWYNVKKLDFSERLWGYEWDQADDFPLDAVLSRCGEFITHAKLKPFFGSNIKPLSSIKIIVQKCPNLRAINLVGVKISGNQLRCLVEHCRKITELYLGETTCDCNDALLEATVFGAYNLRVLELNSNDYVTGSCLKKLPSNSLQKINLSYCFRLYFSVTLEALRSFRNLNTLVLRQTLALGKNDYLPFFDFLSHLNLKELDVSYNDSVVDDNYLIKLASACNNLRRLNIGGNYYVTDVGLAAVTTLSTLEDLVINWLRKVSGMVLMDLPKLRTISCCGCYSLEEEGLIKILRTSRHIKLFNVIYCKKVTENFINAAVKVSESRDTGVPLLIMLNDPYKYEILLQDLDIPLLKLI